MTQFNLLKINLEIGCVAKTYTYNMHNKLFISFTRNAISILCKCTSYILLAKTAKNAESNVWN